MKKIFAAGEKNVKPRPWRGKVCYYIINLKYTIYYKGVRLMPSYRYLRDIKPDETRPDEEKQYTKKERLSNWWHYAWKWVLIAVAVVAVVVGIVVSSLGTVKPDITIGVLSPYTLPDSLVQALETSFAGYVPDLNGDGQVSVSVQVFQVFNTLEDEDGDPNSSLQENPYTVMAGVTQLAGALSVGEPVIYLAYDAELDYYQMRYAIFAYPDTGVSAPEEEDPRVLTVAWQDTPALAAMELDFAPYSDGNLVDGQSVMADFRIGIMGNDLSQNSKKESWQLQWQEAYAIFEDLIEE